MYKEIEIRRVTSRATTFGSPPENKSDRAKVHEIKRKIITSDDFEEKLNLIGWKIKKSWNGLNDVLVAPSGAETDLRVISDYVTPYSVKLYGGERYGCIVKFYFQSMEIMDDGTVSLGSSGGHILFMNHDLKRKK